MIGLVSRLAVTAVAAMTLTAGCASPSGSTAQQHGSSTPVVAAVKLNDLLSAPVPKLCEHEPGNLVNGLLPMQDPHRGHVDVAKKQAASDGYWVTFGDLTADVVDDGALVTACSAGGVPWPATVQLYSAGPTRLGGVDLSDLTHGREVVTGLSIAMGWSCEQCPTGCHPRPAVPASAAGRSGPVPSEWVGANQVTGSGRPPPTTSRSTRRFGGLPWILRRPRTPPA
jgi:hypothetical protein